MAECTLWIKRDRIYCVQATMAVWPQLYVGSLMEKAFNALGMLGCPRHLFTTVHILQYRVPLWSRQRKSEREEEGKVWGHRKRVDVRKYRSGETLLNLLLQEWNPYFYLFFLSICFPASVEHIIFYFSFLCFFSQMINDFLFSYIIPYVPSFVCITVPPVTQLCIKRKQK